MGHKKNHSTESGKDNSASGQTGAKAHSAGSKNTGKIEVLAHEYEDLQRRVAELEGLREKLLHSAADFENAKKRNAREKDEFIKYSQEKILRGLLPALDNFERALNHATAASLKDSGEVALRENLKNLTAGVQMVQKQILDILKSHGLSRLKALGEKFDPHVHEVVGYVPEEGEEDQIVDELEPGYKLHDRLLRAAKVRIRVPPDRRPASQEKQDEIT